MRNINRLVIGALVLGCATASQATPITGGISFEGDIAHGASNISKASTLQFSDVEASAGSGEFDGLSEDESASYKDLTIDPFSGPVTDFWTITVGGDDFGFDLETLNVIDRDPIGGDLGLEGQGTLASDNPSLDATKWTWELSANESSDSAITFSAASANVPEPMTIALMGLGLVGISLVGTRRRTNNLEA